MIVKINYIHKQTRARKMLAADRLRLSYRVGGAGEGTGITHLPLYLSPILTFDILESIKPALKLEGALL
jgi:hypothetical protein